MAQRTTRVTQDEGFTILWDSETGVGLRFKKGDNLSRYTASIILPDVSILENEDGVEKVTEANLWLIGQAEKLFPLEFNHEIDRSL